MTLRTSFEQWVRNHRVQLLAILIKQLDDIQLAEEVLQEALLKLWSLWRQQEQPKQCKNWVLKTACNQAIDVIRRHNNFQQKRSQISHLIDLQQALNQQTNDDWIIDERLKLIFTCCHPALDQSIQVALTLNIVCGFSTEQVADVFLLKKTAMAQRLVRAKNKIKQSGIAYKTPEATELSTRFDAVLAVIYQIYNQGYYAPEKPSLMNQNHSNEAIYLALTLDQLLENQSLPRQAELLGLLALMYFHRSRFNARNHKPGQVISLAEQDRQLWDQDLIAKADNYFTQAIALKSMGAYQIQAAISGVHVQAKEFADTDWSQIVTLYLKLLEYQPTQIVRINLAVALIYNQQAGKALRLLQEISNNKLEHYLPFHLAKAHALRALNQKSAANNSFAIAMTLSKNSQERAYLQNQIDLINY